MKRRLPPYGPRPMPHPFAVTELVVKSARTGQEMKRLIPVPGGYRQVSP